MDTNNSVPKKIKKEKKDDHEINQLALEMAEANRKKMVAKQTELRQQNQVSQQALQRAGGQQMITFYFNKEKNLSSDSLLPKKLEEKKKGTIDEESSKGRFGWTLIQHQHIPYIFRQDELYCAVRMVEVKVLNRYLSNLPQELITCIHVRSYFITDAESKLLNEVNMKHCDCQFGREMFSTKDLVVKLSDAKCFYKFLETCFKKLVQKSYDKSEFCGFVRINGESVVPYTVKNLVKYVPLFYFEGETDTLKLKAERIDGWELAFLKFCCKVQGIRNELFASDTCSVVSLDDVKQYFPRETQFEDWWPQKTAESMRVVATSNKPAGSWTQRPPMPAVSSTPSAPTQNHKPIIAPRHSNSVPTESAIAAQMKNSTAPMPGLPTINNMNLYNQWMSQAQLLAAYSAYPNMQNLMQGLNADHLRRGSTQSANAALLQSINNAQQNARLPNMVRNANASATAAYVSSASRGPAANLEALRQLGYMSDQGIAASMANMLTSRHNPNASLHGGANMISTNPKQSVAKAPPPLIPVASNGIDLRADPKSMGRNGAEGRKLVEVPTYHPDPLRPGNPYKVRKIIIDGKVLLCINLSFFNFNDQKMVAAQDLMRELIPKTSLEGFVEVLVNVLQISVYKANWHQVNALMEAWGPLHDFTVTPEFVPLVRVSDINKYLSQIKYIFERAFASISSSKRLKT